MSFVGLNMEKFVTSFTELSIIAKANKMPTNAAFLPSALALEAKKEEERCQLLVHHFHAKHRVQEKPDFRPECGVCLSELPYFLNHYTPRPDIAQQFLCCGKLICRPCADKTLALHADPESSFVMTSCFFCRCTNGAKNNMKETKAMAKKGQAWAQCRMGFYCETGHRIGQPKNTTKSINWYTRAADQGYTRAETTMGIYHFQNDMPDKGRVYLEKAAMKGDREAMTALVMWYICEREEGKDPEPIMEPFELLSIAATLGSREGQMMMGLLYSGFFSKKPNDFIRHKISMERAEYWLDKALWKGKTPMTDSDILPNIVGDGHFVLAKLLLQRATKDRSAIGKRLIPKAQASAKLSLKLNTSNHVDHMAQALINSMEEMMHGTCAHCGEPGKLKCSKCKITCYCSRQCQAKSWKAGHREDCM